MITVNSVIRSMLPYGSTVKGGSDTLLNENASPDKWQNCPDWPPDLFAVTATLVNRSSAYLNLLDPASTLRDNSKRKQFKRITEAWRNNDWPKDDESFPEEREYLQDLWAVLVECDELIVNANSSRNTGLNIPEWQLAALELMIIADMACLGVGFFGGKKSEQQWIKSGALAMYMENMILDELTPQKSLCQMVPDCVACVLPKTRTSQTGATLRSTTHHLALLPSIGEVEVNWNPFQFPQGASHDFNILFIPYPFHINNKDFVDAGDITVEDDRLFGQFVLKQSWLDEKHLDDFCDFVIEMIREAQRDFSQVHGLLLPELSLNIPFFEQLLERLIDSRLEDINLEIVISGVLGKRSNTIGSSFKNLAGAAVLSSTREGDEGRKKKIKSLSFSPKHHRWKLDHSQITQYSLGDSLNPCKDWWEYADIRNRSMSFYTFRDGSCFTTLICEDLARADPGQQVIRAIGPNLVIALLMDGPQLPFRWPGQYAMGLADDPGSSVLSVTSLGLINRSNHYYGSSSREVALWRDPKKTIKSLKLPEGHHALLINLTKSKSTEYTLDGRSDNGAAYQYLLTGCLPVRHQNIEKHKSWLRI